MLFRVGSFLGFPDVVRPYGRGAGYIDLAVSESLCTLFRQADRVRLFLAGSWVLVDLVKKKVFHGEGSKPGRAVTPNKFYKHIIKIKLQVAAVLIVFLVKRRRILNHGLYSFFRYAVRQGFCGIYHFYGSRILLGGIAQHIKLYFRPSDLRTLAKNYFFRFVVQKLVHNLYKVRGPAVVPWSRFRASLAVKHPVSLRPLGYFHIFRGVQVFKRGFLVWLALVLPYA